MSMVVGASPLRAGVLVAGFILFFGNATAHSAQLNRVEWSPGGGFAGDVWTFRCPAGGSVAVAVDVFGDQAAGEDTFESALDPVLEVFDGQGNLLAAGDDDFQCTAPIACGAACPAVQIDCGQGVKHSIVVRDAGLLPACDGGGTYLLSVEVSNRQGRSLPDSTVKLGGGVAQTVPQWILALGIAGRRGPVINDGPAPSLLSAARAGQLATLAVSIPAKATK